MHLLFMSGALIFTAVTQKMFLIHRALEANEAMVPGFLVKITREAIIGTAQIAY